MTLALALWAATAAVGPRPLAAVQPMRLADSVATVVYWPGDSALAERVRAQIHHPPRLPGLPPRVPEPPVTVILAPSEVILDSLLGGSVPEWGAGVAVPGLGTIVLPVYPSARTRFSDPTVTLRHEWAHLALHDHLRTRDIPRWFDEGYAEWTSGAWGFEEAWRLRLAFVLRRAPPLDSLAIDWPADLASARLAYLLSATALQYLVERSGVRGLEVLFRSWRRSGSFETAVRTTYGVTGGQLEEDWRGFVKRRYGWMLVLSQSAAFWLATGVLVLLLFRIRRRRDRWRLARLRAREPADQPQWWLQADDPGPDP